MIYEKFIQIDLLSFNTLQDLYIDNIYYLLHLMFCRNNDGQQRE